MADLRNYHVVLCNGEERNVRAREVEISNGCLQFANDDELQVAYAAGEWKMVEVERQDDKG